MADFAARFRSYGKDMHLTVDYAKHKPETPWGTFSPASPSHHK